MTRKEKREKYDRVYEKMWKDGYITDTGRTFLLKRLHEIESELLELDSMEVGGVDEVLDALRSVEEFYA